MLDTLNEKRTQVVPLVIGLRQYAETLAESIRIPVGDGSMMAAVKSLNGTQVCDLFGLFDCNDGVPTDPTLPGVPTPPLPGVPPLPADPFHPITDSQDLLDLIQGLGQ